VIFRTSFGASRDASDERRKLFLLLRLAEPKVTKKNKSSGRGTNLAGKSSEEFPAASIQRALEN
jgi:hypothetical protein